MSPTACGAPPPTSSSRPWGGSAGTTAPACTARSGTSRRSSSSATRSTWPPPGWPSVAPAGTPTARPTGSPRSIPPPQPIACSPSNPSRTVSVEPGPAHGAISRLQAWRRAGSMRKDADRDGAYEHTEAIRILDAWWPKLVDAQFAPVLGKPLLDRFLAIKTLDNDPNNHGEHLGSAYQGGTYGLVEKDLRTLLGRKRLRRAGRGRAIARVRGRYSRTYCGGTKRRKGNLRRCRRALARSLKAAVAVPTETTYKDEVCSSQPGIGPRGPGPQALRPGV